MKRQGLFNLINKATAMTLQYLITPKVKHKSYLLVLPLQQDNNASIYFRYIF